MECRGFIGGTIPEVVHQAPAVETGIFKIRVLEFGCTAGFAHYELRSEHGDLVCGKGTWAPFRGRKARDTCSEAGVQETDLRFCPGAVAGEKGAKELCIWMSIYLSVLYFVVSFMAVNVVLTVCIPFSASAKSFSDV